jgi:hypothetical protein
MGTTLYIFNRGSAPHILEDFVSLVLLELDIDVLEEIDSPEKNSS